jgi:hypothetical protein
MPFPLDGTPFKITLQMNAGANGWSESYYFVTSAISPTLADTVVNALVSARAAMWPEGVDLIAARVSRSRGSGLAPSLYYASDLPTVARRTGVLEKVDQAWLFRLSTDDNRYHRQLWLHGLITADNQVTQATRLTYRPTTGFRNALEPLRQLLFGNNPSVRAIGQFAIRAFAREAPPGENLTIDAITKDADSGNFAVKTNTLPAGDNVDFHVFGVRGPGTKGINGYGSIIRVIPPIVGLIPTLVTSRRVLQPGTITATRLGRILLSKFQYYPIRQLQAVRIATHKTGKAFFVSPGHQRARL